MINFRSLFRSFGYAFEGIIALFLHENNARFHLLAASMVFVAGWYLGISATEWALVALAIAGVWGSEAFNTALEKLCDLVSPSFHPQIKVIKDLSAAAVLIWALAAVGVGLIVFAPKILDWIIDF
ncbi:MAG: diacylglycerol kinase family protein [Runella sp.]